MLSFIISQSHGLLNFLGPFDKVFLNHDSLPSPQASLLPEASPGSFFLAFHQKFWNPQLLWALLQTSAHIRGGHRSLILP